MTAQALIPARYKCNSGFRQKIMTDHTIKLFHYPGMDLNILVAVLTKTRYRQKLMEFCTMALCAGNPCRKEVFLMADGAHYLRGALFLFS